MPISNDLRAYADTALGQGSELVTKITTTVSGLGAAATTAVGDLRSQAEKNLNLEAVRTAVEPYLTQARDYGSTVTERAEGIYGAVRNDRRVSGVVERAETVTRPVVTLLQERLVQPVLTLTGRESAAVSEATPAATPKASPQTRQPAKTRPAAPRKSAANKATPSS
jgi:hypothetical protein